VSAKADVTETDARARSARRAGELAVAAGVGLLGLLVVWQTFGIAAGGGYAQVGPRLFPGIVGTTLLGFAVLLAREALAGGFRHVEGVPAAPATVPGFLWVSAAVLVHLAIIGSTGFIAATVVLFVGVARGIGSTRPQRDAVIGLALAIVVFVLFTQGLGLNLPSGPLRLPG
jgi:putative tricarboxylic transport membrane protein